MADEQHDLGEIWATVKGQGQALNQLGVQVSEGFKAIGESIRANHEKTDRRISELSRDTDERIRGVSADYRKSTSERSQNTLNVIGIALATMIGIGGLGATVAGTAFTAYSLMKAPVDQNFSTLNSAVSELARDFKEERQARSAEIKDAVKDFVPNGEIQTNIKLFSEVTSRNTARLDAVEKGIVDGVQERKGIQRDVARLDNDIHELRQAVKQDFATRKETDVQFADQSRRTDSIVMGLNEIRRQLADGNSVGDQIKQLGSELNSLKDKFIYSPTSPVLRENPIPPK